MQLKIRDPNRFGVSGLMSESGNVFYSSDFKTRSLGRVSDLIAAKLKDVQADELRLRALLLYGLYESNALMSGSVVSVQSSPVSLEVGLESDYLVIGISFNWSEKFRPEFEKLETRIGQNKSQTNDFEKILNLIHQNSDHLYVRYADESRQIEVVSVIGLGIVERTKDAPVEVVKVESSTAEAQPGVAEYKELGDLPFVELLKEPAQDVPLQSAPLHEDDSVQIKGSVTEPEVENTIKGSAPEAESQQTVSGLPEEAESVTKLSGTEEEIDGLTVLTAKDAEEGIEEELRKVNGVPTEKEVFTRLKGDGFTESEILMLKSGQPLTPEVTQRLQASNVLPEEIQRINILSQQQQLFQKLESSGFTPLEIQKISSNLSEEPDLIRRLSGMGYQPPEIQSLFSNSFELAERIYEIRTGNAPVPIDAYKRVAAPVFSREELLERIRAQFPELNELEALKASNEEFQRLALAARNHIQTHSQEEAPKSNEDMADWLSTFSKDRRPDIKSIPFNPQQIHAVQATFGTSQIDTKALSDEEYDRFMEAIRKPPAQASSKAQSSRSSFENAIQAREQQQASRDKSRKEDSQKESSRSVAQSDVGKLGSQKAKQDAQRVKQDHLEAELLKKRIQELENQLKIEKANQQVRGASATVSSAPSSEFGKVQRKQSSPVAFSSSDDEGYANDPIEKVEVKGETKRVVSRGVSEPEKKPKETLFAKLFNKKEEPEQQVAQEKAPLTNQTHAETSRSSVAQSATNNAEAATVVRSAPQQSTADDSARLIRGSEQNRGLSGIDQKEFEKIKRELAMKDKRHQEQSELLQRKISTMKDSLEKSERERTQAIRDREKLKSDLEQARIRLSAIGSTPALSGSQNQVYNEEVAVVRGGSAQEKNTPHSNVVSLRDSNKTENNNQFSKPEPNRFSTPNQSAGEAVQNKSGFGASAPVSKEKQTQPETAPQKSGFGSKLLKSLNPFSSQQQESQSAEQTKTISSVTPKITSESIPVTKPSESERERVVEGIDPRVLAMKEKVHERQVDELHRKIKKLEEDNAKLREKSVRIDSQTQDQKNKVIESSSTVARDIQDTTVSEVPKSQSADELNEIEARKRKLDEEDQKILASTLAKEPAVATPPVQKDQVDPVTSAHLQKTEKTLNELKTMAERSDSPTIKKVLSEIQQSVEPSKSKQWTESLMAEVVAEKARIMELQRTLNMEFKVAEQNHRNRENLLQADLQKKDDILRQKEALLNRKNEQLAQLNLQLDQMKQGSAAIEEAQLKHKLSAAQKIAEMKDFENKTLLEKTRDLENKLMIANAKARNTNEAQWKQKIQALEFKLEEAKKSAQRTQDQSTQSKDKANDRELSDLKKKYELAERQQQEMRKLLERTAINLKEKTDSERRFQLEMQKLQEENKKLKALITRAGGSNAA